MSFFLNSFILIKTTLVTLHLEIVITNLKTQDTQQLMLINHFLFVFKTVFGLYFLKVSSILIIVGKSQQLDILMTKFFN